jgi:hypothetical protein
MFTGNFTCVQQTNLTNLLFVDTSTGGTDTNIVDRRIYLYKVDNNTLVPTGTSTPYIDWPIINSSGIGDTININVLPKDYSLNIVINWISTSPISGATYTKSSVFTFTGYTNSGLYKLVQDISARPYILNDTNYYSNLEKGYTELDNANIAQTYSDQYSCQSALDRVYQLLSHQSLYF